MIHFQIREGMEFTKDGTYSCYFHCEVNDLLICLVYRFGVWLGDLRVQCFAWHSMLLNPCVIPTTIVILFVNPVSNHCRAEGLVHLIAGCFLSWSKHSNDSNSSLIFSHSTLFVKHLLMPSSCKSPYPHFSNPFNKIVKNCP